MPLLFFLLSLQKSEIMLNNNLWILTNHLGSIYYANGKFKQSCQMPVSKKNKKNSPYNYILRMVEGACSELGPHQRLRCTLTQLHCCK